MTFSFVWSDLIPQSSACGRNASFASRAGQHRLASRSAPVMFLRHADRDIFWVGFRAGNSLSVRAGTRGTRPCRTRFTTVAAGGNWLALLTLVLGLPTTIIDAYNTQDVGNRLMSVGGFHWTIALTPAQQEGLAWIRAQTAADAIVQAEPVIRERETWTLIPSFAERRMAAGLPISLMHVPAYDEKSEQVRLIYASTDADAAWRAAKQLRIDYL